MKPAFLALLLSVSCLFCRCLGDRPPVVVSVQGYVYCEDCQGRWLSHISDALVRVVCKDGSGSQVARCMDNPDSNGFFQIKVPMYDVVHQPNTTCTASLLTSSDATCNKMSNKNDGALGALIRPYTSFYNEMFFTVGPFAFTPYTC